MVFNTMETSGLDPIPFVGSRQRGSVTTQPHTQSQSPAWASDTAYALPWEHELRQEEQATMHMATTDAAWPTEPQFNATSSLVDASGSGPLGGDAQRVGHWTTHHIPTRSIDNDTVPTIKTEPVKPKAHAKKRAPRKKAVAVRVAPPVLGEQVATELNQVKRKSEIEKKSRQKRAFTIDSMKDQVTRLEQNLLHLIRQQGHQNQYLLAHDPRIQLTQEGRLLQLREKLARLFSDSVELRNQHIQLYQQLQHYVDIKESLANVFSAHDFSDPAVYDLLARWTPPSDAKCVELANESMDKILTYKFTKRCSTDHHAGWKLTYEQSPLTGCQFVIDRRMTSIDVPALTQTIWDARATSEGANVIAGMVCKARISVIKAVSKDMVVVNRSLCFPSFTMRAVYLLFRREVNGQIYVVSRELGSAQDLTMTQAMASAVQDQWIDVFSWSTFEKIPSECTSSEGTSQGGDTYNVLYGGWWNSSFALSIRRWLLEMLFMVVRWENVFIQPRLLSQ